MNKSSINRILIISVLFCALFILLVSCNQSRAYQVTEAQNDGEITLKVGDTLQISLAGNITTGFAWEIAENNTNILAGQGEIKYLQEKTNKAGSGGTFVFTFKAINAGGTIIKIIYHRSFEKNVTPVKEFRLHVNVELQPKPLA